MRKLDYLLVGLSNGYVICFNLYTSQNSVRLCQVFKSGNIVSSIGMPSPDSVLVTSDQNSFLLSVDASSRMDDLVVVSCKDRIESMALLNEKRVCMAIGDDGSSLRVGRLCGPDFGRRFQ